MKIMPINNNQPQFQAKLPKRDINTLVDAALSHDKRAGIPKLYTVLKGLEEIPGDKAELKTILRNSQSDVIGLGKGYIYGNSCQLRIDGKLVAEGSNTFDMLYSLVTSKMTSDGKKLDMPQSIFDKMWWENADKTYGDVENLLRDEN